MSRRWRLVCLEAQTIPYCLKVVLVETHGVFMRVRAPLVLVLPTIASVMSVGRFSCDFNVICLWSWTQNHTVAIPKKTYRSLWESFSGCRDCWFQRSCLEYFPTRLRLLGWCYGCELSVAFMVENHVLEMSYPCGLSKPVVKNGFQSKPSRRRDVRGRVRAFAE